MATKFRALSAYHSGRPIHVYVNKSPDHASIGLVNILPMVEKGFESPRALYDVNCDMSPGMFDPRWSTLSGSSNWREFDYLLCANGHLERGQPLRTFLPELTQTEWQYDLKLTDEDHAYARRIAGGPRKVLLYPSGTGANKGFHSNWWTVRHWVEVVERLNAVGIEPVFVGNCSKADLAYSQQLFSLIRARRVRCLSVIGRTSIPQIMALIKDAAVWCGLNSGLGIMSAMMRTPTLMFWCDSRYPIPNASRLLPQIQTSWLNEEQLRTYATLSYGSPQLTPLNVVHTLTRLIRC